MKPAKFLILYYIHQFFFDLILIYAVEKLFFVSRGIDLSQIGILLFLWSAMSLILEVPTGILADKWSRRKMLILSGIFFSLCYFIWIFSDSFILFLLGFFFRTLGATFASGKLQAYLFDFLKLNNLSDNFEKILGRGNALRTLGIGTAVLLGGFLSQISYEIVLVISSISILVISLIALMWPEIKSVTPTGEEGFWTFLVESFKTVKNNKILLRIILFSVIVLAIFGSIEEFNDLYLSYLGFANSIIGIVFSIATVGQSLASLFAHKLKKHVWLTLSIVTIFSSGILILASLIKTPLMAIGILSLGIMLELCRVLNEGEIQRHTKPDQRATIASLNSFVMNILPYQLIFGFIANIYTIQIPYLIFGLVALSYFIFLPLLNKEEKIIRS